MNEKVSKRCSTIEGGCCQNGCCWNRPNAYEKIDGESLAVILVVAIFGAFVSVLLICLALYCLFRRKPSKGDITVEKRNDSIRNHYQSPGNPQVLYTISDAKSLSRLYHDHNESRINQTNRLDRNYSHYEHYHRVSQPTKTSVYF